jgi:nucleoside-diphosphate-sugar epimerase
VRIAITGGTGFAGGHLARDLAAAGHEVVLIARGVDRRDEAVRSLPGIRFEPARGASPS